MKHIAGISTPPGRLQLLKRKDGLIKRGFLGDAIRTPGRLSRKQLLSSHLSCVRAQSLQSCPTLCDSLDCSPPGSSVHGILRAIILECVAMTSSRGSSRHRDQTHISYVSCIGRQDLLLLAPPGTITQMYLITKHK